MGCITSQQLPPPNTHEVDLTHFTLCRVLGRGGFGKVNAVLRRTDERYFAMKSISKHKLIRKEHSIYMTWLERKVMSSFQSEFLVSCVYAFQDSENLYMVMPLMLGGDLRYYLKQHGPCRESDARFFMAEILLALQHMHSLRIVYRDLKPDNVLLDSDGHLRLSDFGLSGRIRSTDGKTSGYCGTHGYIAPEVLMGRRYDGSCDVYAFGVVLYELLCRYVPYRAREERARLSMEDALMNGGGGDDKRQQQEDERKDREADGLQLSSRSSPQAEDDELFDPRLTRKGRGLSAACRELLSGLLQEEPSRRLGFGCADRWEEIKRHSWFAAIDWTAAAERRLQPPFRPNVSIANCDPVFELEEQIMNQRQTQPPLSSEDQLLFQGWEFNTRLGAGEAGAAEQAEAKEDAAAIPVKAPPELQMSPEPRWGIAADGGAPLETELVMLELPMTAGAEADAGLSRNGAAVHDGGSLSHRAAPLHHYEDDGQQEAEGGDSHLYITQLE